MKQTLSVALVQCDSGPNKEDNLSKAVSFCMEAISKGATFILLPELFNIRSDTISVEQRAENIPGPSLGPLMKLAKEKSVFILAGSLCESSSTPKKCYNTSVLINSNGSISCTYQKIHLFDACVGETKIMESRTFLPGKQPILSTVQDWKVGLSICYDLRFPELYRHYSRHNAHILTVPASFTTPTGEAHWEVLLKARAIENQCYVLAPNQVGIGARGVPTYGNSMIIDPWGKICARGTGDKEEVILAELEMDVLHQVRNTFPVLSHRQL
ncbi:MAG: carbon-nitrogen hydrolase family protein [Candidatus Margulisbacteria bacterium]|nr:carbon-nitrogen hydrolase family protein [Candidatus Margulisiibacteriota bacterium]